MKTVVIGAGPAGLTAAYQLAKQGVEVEIFEASSQIGGMCRSLQLWGQTVDIGPHRFFSPDARVNRLWLEVADTDYRMVDRLTRIYFGGRFFHYPLQPANALANLGAVEATKCLLSYARQALAGGRTADHDSFQSWVTHRFGERLFTLFFKPYSERLWGLPCDELDCEFAIQRIKKFSLGEAIKGAFGVLRSNHTTAVDRFAFPVGGTGMIYQRMAEAIEDLGGAIHLRTPVNKVLKRGSRVTGVQLMGGLSTAADHVVSTMPFTRLVSTLDGVPLDVKRAAASLTYRNTIVVYLNVKGADLFPDQWLYVHSPDLETGRVTNFRNWVPELYGDRDSSILALEYWCNSGDVYWRESDMQLVKQAEREVRQAGLIGGAPVIDGRVVRVPRSYPVYSKGYKQHLNRLAGYLRQIEGVTPIGRYGSFKYNNQDHSILMGLIAADNIAKGTNHDLWEINTDYEYQEKALIGDTGLVTPAA